MRAYFSRYASLATLGIVLLTAPTVLRPAMAQPREAGPFTLVLNGTPLPQALGAVVRLTHIDLVYSSALVAGKRAYCTGEGLTAEGLLRCVLTGTGLDYVRSSSGAYLLMERREAPALFGYLAGQVVDATTGAPLPFASVLLAEAATGTTTDEAGLFNFAGLLSGPHRVVVTYVGYETAWDSVWVAPGGQAQVLVRLHPRAVPLRPVVVDGLRRRLPSQALGAGVLDRQGLTTVGPGGALDVAYGAARLPGVAATQPLADLHIQGGADGEHLTLLDGIPVRNPVSLGRHLGAFSPLALQRLSVHKAGFGPEQGSHLSGLVAVTHDLGGDDRLAFSADPVSLNGRLRLALPGRRGNTLMVAGRSSLWRQYQDPGVAALLRQWNSVDPQLASRWLGERVTARTLAVDRPLPDVAFSDLHAALRLTPAPFQLLEASLYRARNHISANLTALNQLDATPEDRLILTRDDYDWSNWVAQARYSRLLGPRAVLALQAGGSWHASQYGYRALQTNHPRSPFPPDLGALRSSFEEALLSSFGSYEHNTLRELGFRATLGYGLTPGRRLDLGLFARHIDTEFNLGNPFVPTFRYQEAAWEGGGYLKGTLTPGWRLTLEPGVRFTYLSLRRKTYLEPRLALRYDHEGTPLGPVALRLAAGLYRQYVNQFALTSSGSTAAVPALLFWLPVDRTTAPPRVYHLAGEVLLQPSSAWTVRVEGYYKAQPRLLALDYVALVNLFDSGPRTPLPQSAFVTPTRGRAYGGAVRLRYAGARAGAGLGYGYNRALRRYPGRFGDRLIVPPWNTPHRLTGDAEVQVLPALALHLAGEGAWGRRWALRRAYYDYLAPRSLPENTGAFDLTRPDDHRLPAYLRLDLGLSFRHTLERVTLHLQAFLVNVLNRRNVYDWSLENDGAAVRTLPRLLPGRYPVFALRVTY